MATSVEGTICWFRLGRSAFGLTILDLAALRSSNDLN